MKLENTLTIPVPVEEAWKVLLDIERIAPCVPGATLTSQDGDSYHGKVKVKLGPIGLTYSGSVTFLSLDEPAKVAVMEAGGRETRGGGTAKAVVTCRLIGQGDSTDVVVDTDLAITGKPAQFGRSTLADVSTTLIGQFAANLANEIAPTPAAATVPVTGTGTGSGTGSGTDTGTAPSHAAAPSPGHTTAESIDLLQAAGGGVLGRVAPIAAAVALLLILLRLLRRRPSAPGVRP